MLFMSRLKEMNIVRYAVKWDLKVDADHISYVGTVDAYQLCHFAC